jgi:hypothetical protein
VEETQTLTNIPDDTTTSTISETSTTETTTSTITEVPTDNDSDYETGTIDDPDTEPSSTPGPTETKRSVFPFVVGATIGSAALVAAGAAFFKSSARVAGTQLANNVFEENVGVENPLYQGTGGQNENPLYEANVNFDSLDDNMELGA